MKLKIFGERNTSTRALEQMLTNNSQSRFCPGSMKDLAPITAKTVSLLQRFGIADERREALVDQVFRGRHLLEQWKHAATVFELDDRVDGVHFVFALRDPRSWLIGLFRKPYHILVEKPKTLLEFSRLDWKPVARDNLPKSSYRPLELYAEKLRSYIELINALERRNASYSIVKFEDFVTGQQAVFERIRPYLTSPADPFVELSKSTKDNSKDAGYYANYYSNELWRGEYPEIDAVELPESAGVFKTFGYSLR